MRATAKREKPGARDADTLAAQYSATTRLLLAWVRSLRLSRDCSDPRAWRKAFANGALVAEAFARYLPAHIEPANYHAGASSRRAKETNWMHLQKFAKRLDISLEAVQNESDEYCDHLRVLTLDYISKISTSTDFDTLLRRFYLVLLSKIH